MIVFPIFSLWQLVDRYSRQVVRTMGVAEFMGMRRAHIRPGRVGLGRPKWHSTSDPDIRPGEKKIYRMFIAMNRFRVAKGSEAAFEQVWLSRDSHLDTVPGFAR